MPKEPSKQEILREIQLKLDDTDRKIMNLLNKDAYLTLKEISSKVGMSIDAVKNRIRKMRDLGVIDKIIAIPWAGAFGYNLAVQVYIKLHNISEQSMKEFIAYTKSHPRIIVSMSMIGEYDFYIVLLTKDTEDLDRQKTEIKSKFSKIIADWRETMASQVYKYEEYNF